MTTSRNLTPPLATQTVAFVLASYRPDEPAGMERAVAAMAAGLRKLGHQALIIDRRAPARPRSRRDHRSPRFRSRSRATTAPSGTPSGPAGPALARELEADAARAARGRRRLR